jgi:lipid-A-disaccharide synthase-like uncharacterized protein
MKIFGFIGIILVQGSTLFQIQRFYLRKRSADVSIGFWWMIYLGLYSYLVYSIYIVDWIYITSNSIGLILSSISIIMYYHYRKREGAYNGDRIDLDCNCDSVIRAMGHNESLRPDRIYAASGEQLVSKERPMRRSPIQGSDSRQRSRRTDIHQVLPAKNIDPYSWKNDPQLTDKVLKYCYQLNHYWINDQSWPKYLGASEAEGYLNNGYRKDYQICPACQKGVENVKKNKGGGKR